MARQKTYFELQVEKISRKIGLAEYQYLQVRQSKHFMEKYYSDKIELNKIAVAACMSRFHYIRLFQNIYGMTPRKFLRDLRIYKAKELLRKGVQVTQACYEVGYDSLPSFSKAFKEGTGFSPKTYRQLNNSNLE